VSAFGLSGTNAHVVLEEPPREISAPASPSSIRQVAADEAGDRGPHLLTISAKTPEALRQLADELAAHLEATPDLALGDVCFTANGRSLKPCRAAWTVTSIEQARNCLRGPMTGVDVGGMRPRIAFLFSGEPAAAAGMAANLYASEPVFRAAVDRVSALLGSRLPRPLPELICGDNVDWLVDVAVAPSLVFAIDWALAELWKAWGITPDVVLGQGVGEHAAACVAGIISLENALQLALRPDLPGPAADLPSRIAFVSAGEAQAGVTPPQRFAAALRGLAADRCDVFLEVGPSAHLLDVGRECLPDHAALWLPSLEPGRCARRSMLDSLGALYLKGADPDLREAYRGHPCRIVSLPTYPFQRRH
jgi:acyl transferase domain-containing protein